MYGLPATRSCRRLLVAVAAVLSPAVAAAESPTTAADIEIYHGTRKVSPLPKPPADPSAGPKAMAVVATTLHDAAATAGTAFGRILDRTLPKWDAPRLPLVVNVTVPQPPPAPAVMLAGATVGQPGLLPWAYPTPVREPAPREDAKPNVIIIREAAPAAAPVPAPLPQPEPGGVRVGTETLFLAVGLLGVGALVTAGVRRRATLPQPPVKVIPADHLAVGGWDAGKLPQTAEAFDVGPTYADELAQRKDAEKAHESALLSHILDQNLALQAELQTTEDDG